MSSLTNEYIDGDTITAIATPLGSGGIGIIRISGEKATDIAKSVFRKSRDFRGPLDPTVLDRSASHHLNHGYLYDPRQQEVLDEVLLVIMRAPNSYTREDVVEIQSHSGPVILSKILNVVMACGARLARPGEFTRRAFLNGRIDLSQAEAVSEMISARSDGALKLAVTQLTGYLKENITEMIEKISDLQVELEAGLEFGDEIGGPEVDFVNIESLVGGELIPGIEKLLQCYDEGYRLRDGIRLGIVGRPNVGKSSLLNYLIRKDRAIVTAWPGTTRDLIEEHICIDGLPLILTDTAGLHATQDPIEIIGIEKTRESLQQADLVLFVVDGHQPFLASDEMAFDQLGEKKIIVVINKLDMIQNPEGFVIPSKYQSHPVVFVSAKFGLGIDLLKERIKEEALGKVSIEPGRSIVPTLRQKLGLESALDSLNKVRESIVARCGEELLLVDLGLAKEALNEIIGKEFSADLLDEIFGRFCIGK